VSDVLGLYRSLHIVPIRIAYETVVARFVARLFVIAASLLLPIGATTSPTPSVNVVDGAVRAIGPFARAAFQKGEFSGVIAIARDGRILMEEAYGLADESPNLPNRPDTRFVVASVTQTFTAVAVAQLLEQERIRLDATVSNLLPGLPHGPSASATVRRLLTHTAGVDSVARSPEFRRAPKSFGSLADYMSLVESEPLAGEPGRFRYTDGDSVLLGAIVESASGQSYYRYVRDHVLRPARMNDTGFLLLPRPSNLAIGYTMRDIGGGAASSAADQARQENSAMLPALASPGFAAYSTAGDLVRFGTALLKGNLLSADASADLLGGKIPTGEDGPRRLYGYGFFDGELRGVRIVNHGGTGPGIDVGFDIYPALGLVVAVMANQDPPAAQRIRDELRNLLTSAHP
jgi:CubicO group peptidase (beta-lactamase class C family)